MDKIKLFIVKPERYHKAVIEKTRDLADKKGLYVALSRSGARLKATFTEENIPVENINFLDGVCELTGQEKRKEENCTYINNPENMSSIGIAISRELERLKDEDLGFILVDSISSLHNHSKEHQILKFMHSLTAEMRSLEIETIFFCIDGEFREDSIKTLSGFCDQVEKIA